MKILVVGRGGREHALCEKIASSPLVDKVFVAPGNPGMRSVAITVPYLEDDQEGLVRFARQHNLDLVVIGPEKPLVDGLADRFLEEGIPVFGPSPRAAQIEGSKSFAKALMAKYGIPTADYREFTAYTEARSYLEQSPVPIVIKADGLAAGKGVVVAHTKRQAQESLEEMLQGKKFGEASSKVIIEECLQGEEFSLMALVQGELVVPLDVAQDHKRALDGNQGPNTGGMGAYSPVPQIPSGVVEQAIAEILEPTAKALVLEGRPFTGVLYAGLMLTSEGPKVIEFNARFGDPETQVLLPRLESDLVAAMLAVLAGERPKLKWSSQGMVGVVVASKGYPGPVQGGVLLPSFRFEGGSVSVYYSGVAEKEEGLVSAGGRVYLAGCLGDNLREAQQKVYDFLCQYDQPEFFYRRDIGQACLDSAAVQSGSDQEEPR
jgi:phosphoribosylamine--glycine ligase